MMSGFRETEPAFDLPPGYTVISLRESRDAFAHCLTIAADAGARTLIWVGRYDLVEFAVVLEPDEPLVSARRALFAGMNAIGDAIAAHCPPERAVGFEWPDAIFFDQGLVGGARLGWPRDCGEDELPAWLVLGVMLRAADMAELETASAPWGTSLMGAGFEMVETEALIGSFARHLMTGFDQWNERGFGPIADAYLARLSKKGDNGRRAIDRNGDLLIDAPADGGSRVRASLFESLARVAWYDPDLRGPRLGKAKLLKLPRSIRLDPSDTFVFERAADPGEWVISGAFVFGDCNDPTALGQKQRVASRSGFLGIESLGWSTLAIVTEATEADVQSAVARLAAHLLTRFGVPDLQAARVAAEEVGFATSRCDHPPQTLLAVQRSFENGEIRERFRTLKPRKSAPGADQLHAQARAFTFHEIESEEGPEEHIDLPGLTKADRT